MRSGGAHANPPGLPAEQHQFDDELVTQPLVPTLIRFSAPLLMTNFLHSLSGTWGAVWVSNILGPAALTAVVNANVFLFMVMGMVFGIAGAAGIAVGQAAGAHDLNAIKRVTGTAATFIIAVGILVATLGYQFTHEVIDLMNMPAEVVGDADIFLKLVCLQMPVLFAFIFLMMLMRGQGDAKTPFRFSVLWIGIAMLLGPLFLTGSYGFPELGIAGIAIGGIIANVIALVLLIVYIYWKRFPFALRGDELLYFIPDRALIKMLITRGFPMAFESLIVQGAYFVLLSQVNGYGVTTAAAYAAAAQLWGYVQMPAISIAASMSALGAITIGANRWDRVEQLAIRGCILSMGITAIMTLLVYAFGDLPLKLFLPDNPESIEIARHINYITLWGWIVLSVTSGLAAIVRANGAMMPPALVFFITMWLLRVPIAVFLQPYFGTEAIWWSFPIGSIASALLAYLYFRYGKWRENEKLV